MGKRKSSKKPQAKRKNEPLPKIFPCLFCNHEHAVYVTLDKKESYTGNLECKVCGQRFQCAINYLSAEVDVYSEWVDAADTLAQEAAQNASASTQRSLANSGTLRKPNAVNSAEDNPGAARPSQNLEPLDEYDEEADVDGGAGTAQNAAHAIDDDGDEY